MACRHSCRIWSFCNQKLSGYTKIHAILPMFSICSLIIQAFQILNRYFKMTLLFGNETFCQENSRDSESAWKLMRNRRRKFFKTFLFYRWIFEKFCKLLWNFTSPREILQEFCMQDPEFSMFSKKIDQCNNRAYKNFIQGPPGIHPCFWDMIQKYFSLTLVIFLKNLYWKIPNLHNSKNLPVLFSQ